MNSTPNFYLNRFSFRKESIQGAPESDLGIVVVIPCFNETLLSKSIQSLFDCTKTKCSIEIIIVYNCSEGLDDIRLVNERAMNDVQSKFEWSSRFRIYHLQENSLPKKHAGVGLARKIGMDEAVRRFGMINNHDGVILCFDADSVCEASLLVEVERFFENNKKATGISIHFEHPLEGNEYSKAIYDAIIDYELHLRYYINVQRWCGLPYAFQTIGSSMAVRSSVYQKEGGMNRRKAGEDFYFLHKVIALGDFYDLKSTKTIPSPRQSDRVPFGTGKAVNDIIQSGESLTTYALQSFVELKEFINDIPLYYKANAEFKSEYSPLVISFLNEQSFESSLEEINQHSTTIEGFKKRFYHWFNAFMIMKFAHYSRDNYYSNDDLFVAVNDFFEMNSMIENSSKKEQLETMRLIDLQ